MEQRRDVFTGARQVFMFTLQLRDRCMISAFCTLTAALALAPTVYLCVPHRVSLKNLTFNNNKSLIIECIQMFQITYCTN